MMMTVNIKDTLYSLLPTPIYKYLSNQYHQFLNFRYSIRNHENYDVENIYVAGLIGIIFGLILVTFLEFFPGEPFSYELEKDNTTQINNNKNDCDIVSKSKIEEMRKKLDLTEEEIIKIMNKKEEGDEDLKQKIISSTSQQGSTSRDIEDDLELTLTQKLNLLIYGSLIVGLICVLNKDYDSVVTLWFVRMFPKEAATLGFNMGN